MPASAKSWSTRLRKSLIERHSDRCRIRSREFAIWLCQSWLAAGHVLEARERVMAGSGARAFLLAMVCLAFAAATAVAQDVPLPTPRPKAGPAMTQSAATAPAAPQAPAPKGFFPFSLPFGGKGGATQATAFDARQ